MNIEKIVGTCSMCTLYNIEDTKLLEIGYINDIIKNQLEMYQEEIGFPYDIPRSMLYNTNRNLNWKERVIFKILTGFKRIAKYKGRRTTYVYLKML